VEKIFNSVETIFSQKGVDYMQNQNNNPLRFALNEMSELKNDRKKIEGTFTEILKDEINSIEESQIFNNVISTADKYKDDNNALDIIEDVFKAITGGASLAEILLVTKDELVNPTPINVINTDTLIKNNDLLEDSNNQM
jgi:hemerythrin superfamily protein